LVVIIEILNERALLGESQLKSDIQGQCCRVYLELFRDFWHAHGRDRRSMFLGIDAGKCKCQEDGHAPRL